MLRHLLGGLALGAGVLMPMSRLYAQQPAGRKIVFLPAAGSRTTPVTSRTASTSTTATSSRRTALSDEAASRREASAPPHSREGLRLIVSTSDRTMWAVEGDDTLRTIPVAVASGRVLEYGGRRWHFTPPEGRRVVRGKKTDPVWSPPDWHYAEVARALGLTVARMNPAGTVLKDGRRLEVRDSVVGIVADSDSVFAELPVEEHIIFDSTLFIPPLATRNRQLTGELGKYALDLGDGFLLHGTRDTESIGTASTHGCIRIADDDLEWLFEHIPIGAAVYVR